MQLGRTGPLFMSASPALAQPLHQPDPRQLIPVSALRAHQGLQLGHVRYAAQESTKLPKALEIVQIV